MTSTRGCAHDCHCLDGHAFRATGKHLHEVLLRLGRDQCEVLGAWAATTTMAKHYEHKTASELAEIVSDEMLAKLPGPLCCRHRFV